MKLATVGHDPPALRRDGGANHGGMNMYLGRTTGAAIAAFSAVLMTSSAPVAAADYVLRFGSINAVETASYAKVLEPFARAVEQESAGRIEVALKPIGGYGKPSDPFNLVEKGAIEIAATVQGYNPGRFPQSSVMELPLMYENSIAGTEAMWSLYKEGLLDKDYASVKVLGLYVLPPYGIFTTGKKIAALKDLRGMRMRTPSPTVGLALARLGAIPIGIPVNLVGESIANGTIDAVAYGWDSATTTRGVEGKFLADQVSVLVDANFAAPTLMVVMNRAKWDELPPELQQAIEKNCPPLAPANARLRDEVEAGTQAE